MLYVFLVDNGTMIQLDMNLALEKVSYLKGVIARSCRIPHEKQVLLISGGESLDSEERVCKYSAGTDTNPIFLFSMLNIESPFPPEEHHEKTTEIGEAELNEKVNASLQLDDSQGTVAIRATLAQEYVKASSEQTHICEMLIHDQHLQHQGWSAVVANLEDLAIDLRKNSERLVSDFKDYLEKRDDHLAVIDNFDEDIAVLHRIPVFASLLNPSINPEMSIIGSDSFDTSNLSLLDWINAKGSSQSLEQVAEGCYRSLQTLDEDLLQDLKGKVSTAIEGAQNGQMKEIRGLGDRLSGLEQLLLEAKRLVQEQQKLAAAFVQNQQRATGLRDVSILPDLCASHRQQLLVMQRNHQQIISISSRTAKAKNELSANLHHRMKWVVYVQNQISEVSQLMVMHVEELRRLRRKLDVVEQIHMAPSIYMATAVEVVRRRAFSEQYLKKAGNIAESFSALHDEEMSVRRNFTAKLRKHFLSKMFPGMEDLPPSFATERPDKFDHLLPEITLEDIEMLRSNFPDLAKSLSLPGENALSNLLAKSFNQSLTQEDGEALFQLQNMPRKISLNTRDIGSMSMMNQLISGTARKPSSARMSAISDDTDDSDDDGPKGRTSRRISTNGKKKKIPAASEKLTRSLPHESITQLTRNTSTGFDLEVDKSTSSADPSSSSAGNTTGHNSVAPSTSSGDGSVVKSNINGLKIECSSDEKLAKLQETMKTQLAPCLISLTHLKSELSTYKQKIQEDKDSFQQLYAQLSADILSKVVEVNEHSSKRLSLVMEDMESRVRQESESDLDKVRGQLELEMQKLEDCHREIDIYQQQLEHASQEVDKLKSEQIEAKEIHESDKQKLVEDHDVEKAEIVKKLTLEHEIELDALREELENSEKVANCEAEVKRLREVLQLKESDVEALRRKTRLLEMNQEEKFHAEKDKIVQILEAGFSQREKLSLQKCEEEMQEKFNQTLKQQQENWQKEKEKALKNVQSSQKSELEDRIAELEKEHQRHLEKVVQETMDNLRQKFDEERENALKTQQQQLTKKAKNEIDALRWRFKMMQTTGALDRSPSCSESELGSLELQNPSYSINGKPIKSPIKQSPRQDMIETIRSAIKIEYENSLKSEQAKWERQIQQLKEEHEQTLVETMSREKIRDTAEQQIVFNEALNKAMEDKNKQVEQLQEELDQFQNHRNDGDLVQQLADLGKKNTQLEAELKEAKLKLDQMMSTSVMTLNRSDQDPDLQRLQKENAHLKEQLTKSMLVLVSSGKVNVASVDRGDIVMVVWNEDHNNFSIYTEPTFDLPLHFLHNESTQLLGLTLPPTNNATKRYTTAEVVDKEYCQAKKSENRFRVPQGTKFYRVRCKPVNKENIMTKSNGKSD